MSTRGIGDRLPTADEIAEINRTHLIETPLVPADLLFMFGTREDVALRADTAAKLWREGYFRWAIVSGGVTPGSEQSECTIIKAAMIAAGIPAELVLEEHRAMNTGENVLLRGIEILFLGAEQRHDRAQAGIELLERGRGECEAHRVRCMAVGDREGG
jgi:DUF218 domain-containing protein